MISSVKIQFKELIGKKSVIITYFILMGFMIVNFIINMIGYSDVKYVSEMYDPIKMMTLSTWSKTGYFLRIIYPILVCIPASAVYRTNKESISINYMRSKAVAIFLVTFLVFTIPFILEFVLSCICFNINSLGDPTNVVYTDMEGMESRYFLSELWLNNRIAYAIVMIVLFGTLSGILAVFNFSICTLPIFKFKILTFLPIFVMFQLINLIDKVVKFRIETNYSVLISMFDKSDKLDGVYLIFMMALLIVSFMIIRNKRVEAL